MMQQPLPPTATVFLSGTPKLPVLRPDHSPGSTASVFNTSLISDASHDNLVDVNNSSLEGTDLPTASPASAGASTTSATAAARPAPPRLRPQASPRIDSVSPLELPPPAFRL